MKKLVHYLIALYVFTIPWEGVITIPGLGTASRLIGILLGGLCFLDLVVTKRHRMLPASFKLLMLFVGLAFASSLWTFSDDLTMERNITYLQLVVVSWIMFQYTDSENRLQTLMLMFLCGCCVAFGSTLWDYFNGVTSYSASSRFTAEGSDPNEQALILATAIPQAWYLSRYGRIPRMFIWILILIVMVGILLTGSRTGLICMVLALAVVPATSERMNMANVLKMLTLSAVLLFAAVTLLPESTVERYVGTSTEIKQGSFSDRGDIWRSGFASASSSIWFGVGAGSLREAEAMHNFKKNVAHNTLLSILFEMGIVGLSLYLTALFVIVRNLFLLDRERRNIFVIIFLTWLTGVQTLTFEHSKATWYLLVLLVASVACFKRESFVAGSEMTTDAIERYWHHQDSLQ